MFKLKKVLKARKRLNLLTSILFKIFQFNLRYIETRNDYGLEIFEYFYLPWRSDKEFNKNYNLIKDYTLNPKSRLYTIHEMSKKYLLNNTTYVEVGTWKGGVSGLVSLANKNKVIDYFLCDTFSGVVNSSEHDTFFKNNEYNDATTYDIKNVEKISNSHFKIVKGKFPDSFENLVFKKPISFAHIDVDTYISAKQSLNYILDNSLKGAVVILDDYGGWFTDGVTKYGNELKSNEDIFVVPNHLGQLIIYKI